MQKFEFKKFWERIILPIKRRTPNIIKSPVEEKEKTTPQIDENIVLVNPVPQDKFPDFVMGKPNLAKESNTIKVRDFIKREFGLDFEKDSLQCTEYAHYKVLKELSIKINWVGRAGPRHGAYWPDVFIKLKRYKISGKPKRGNVMSFSAGCPVPPGHVAFVEEVDEENKKIFISEANWPPKGQAPNGHYNERWLSKEDWENKFKARFIDFI